MKKTLGCMVALLSALSIGCGPETTTGTSSSSSGGSGMGSLALRISGGNTAKSGIPSEENGAIVSFLDGWSVKFARVLVSFGAIDLHGTDGATAIASTDKYIADIHAADQTLPVIEGLAARQWEHFGFEISPPDATTKVIGVVEDGYIQTMIAGKYNYWFEGTATKGADTVNFVFGVPSANKNTDCKNGLDDSAGITIQSGTNEAEITIHTPHVFFDGLQNETANLRFEALSIVRGADNKIDVGEVASQGVPNVKDANGMPLMDPSGNVVTYKTNGIVLPTADLFAFMQASTAAMAHLNGKGLCTTTGL